MDFEEKLAEQLTSLLNEFGSESEEVLEFLFDCKELSSDTKIYLQQTFNRWSKERTA